MYQLGDVVLPVPKKFTRQIIEKGVEHLLVFGKTTKRTENRKERFILEYLYLTSAVVDSILSQFQLDESLVFTVDETSLEIGPTDVLMDIPGIDYPPAGDVYMHDVQIVLTEVI